jgi:ribonuclease D
MHVITTTEDLASFCTRAAQHPYVTVDTEFLRERTYYAKLCLVQAAYPGEGEDSAVLIDPLAEGLSLEPLIDLFRDPAVTKVFHAARQDLEIFLIDYDVLPHPLFDTQVAAMVCGFGDQVGYETLVRKIARAGLDKTSRFTDWSRRPLSDAQKTYALADVTHLRVIYEYLAEEIDRAGRRGWVEEELQVLLTPGTYLVEPQEAWRRVKTRTSSGKFLAAVQTLAQFRETYAQARNVPRNRVFKDDALLELASTKPGSLNDLGKSRLLLREARKGDIADGILSAISQAKAMPPEQHPKADTSRDKLQVNSALADLLRVLLKAKSEDAGVAQRMIASSSELDEIASGERGGPALRGWRAEVFGNDALRLCDGKIALGTNGRAVRIVDL